MGPNEKQKIEIEKLHWAPLPPLDQAVTADYSDFLGTALICTNKIGERARREMQAFSLPTASGSPFWITTTSRTRLSWHAKLHRLWKVVRSLATQAMNVLLTDDSKKPLSHLTPTNCFPSFASRTCWGPARCFWSAGRRLFPSEDSTNALGRVARIGNLQCVLRGFRAGSRSIRPLCVITIIHPIRAPGIETCSKKN